MKHLLIVAVAIVCVAAVPAKADLICPKGSLYDFNTELVWKQYRVQKSEYLKQWHARLSRRLKAVLDANGLQAQMRAAGELGLDRNLLMQRIFEEGFIAATDIVNAHCVQAPNTEPWSDAIKRERQAKWCREWGDAHFCPKIR